MCVRMPIHRTFYSLQLLPVPSAYSERHCSTFALFPMQVGSKKSQPKRLGFPPLKGTLSISRPRNL